VREEDAELGYGQGGGNMSVRKRCSRRDEVRTDDWMDDVTQDGLPEVLL
jgi:hypothetical protein